MILDRIRSSCALVATLAAVALHMGSKAHASSFEACVAPVQTPTCGLGPSPASDSWSNETGGSSSASASAFAEGGRVGGVATASSSGTVFHIGAGIICSFWADMIVDDVIITGPGSDVSTRLAVHVEGAFNCAHGPTGSGGGYTIATLEVLDGIALAPTVEFNSGNVNGSIAYDQMLTTDVFTAPVDQPFTVRMQIYGSASTTAWAVDAGIPGSAVFTNDFGSTFGFPTDVPVFDLPPGYTANSVDGRIVDNQFVPDGVPCPADLDANGVVDLADLLDVLARWGTNPGGPPDFDGDGIVGLSDVLTVLAAWGGCS